MIGLKEKQLERIEKKLDSILEKLEEKEPSDSLNYGVISTAVTTNESVKFGRL